MEETLYTDVEVYEYPADCLASELNEYFCAEPFQAQSLTSSDEAWREDLNTYIFRFNVEEAERILEQTDYYLEEEDVDSLIRVRRYEAPPKALLVTSDTKVNARMLKKQLKKFGELKSCTSVSDDQLQYVINFNTSKGEEELLRQRTLQLASELSITVQEYSDKSATQPTTDSTADNQGQVVEPIRDVLVSGNHRLNQRTLKKVFKGLGEVESYTQHTDDNLQFIVTFIEAEDAEKVANMTELAMGADMKLKVQLYDITNETCSLSDSLHSSLRETTTSRCSTPPSFLTLSDGTSSPRPQPTPRKMAASEGPAVCSRPTHVQIDRLPEETVDSMYTLLVLHLKEVFGESYLVTQIAHSYDTTQDLFRFDASASEINALVNTKQQLQEGDDSTTLIIHPLTTGTDVQVKVIANPKRISLGSSHLYKYFGMSSNFKSRLYVQLHEDRADLRMETCSVASLVVSIGKHVLDNKIELQASFPSDAVIDGDITYSASEPTANVVQVQTTASFILFKKLLKSKLKATLIDRLEEGVYLIEYACDEDASKLAMQKTVRFGKVEMNVSSYNLLPLTAPAPSFSHIEVKTQPVTSPGEMHMMLLLHFGDVLGHEVTSAYEHSYDENEKVFRFDLSAEDISKLCNEPQVIECEDEAVELFIRGAYTDKRLDIHSRSTDTLTKALIKDAFGPSSLYACTINFLNFDGTKATIELETHSVAARVVSKGTHLLPGGKVVKTVCVGEEGSGDLTLLADISDVDEPVDDVQDSSSDEAADSTDTNQDNSVGSPTDQQPTTLLLSNLMGADESVIYYWLKSLTGVWPSSIQLSVAADGAIVKLPPHARFDPSRLNNAVDADYELFGGKVTVTQASSCTQVQVICSSREKGAKIDEFTLESFVGSPKYTHVSLKSLKSVKYEMTYNGLQVFIATYFNSQDVCCLLDHRPYSRGQWTFYIVEFYPEIGVCDSNNLYMCEPVDSSSSNVHDGEEKQPILHINNLDKNKTDMEMLELLMSNRRRPTGGEIKSWKVSSDRSTATASVQVVYKEAGVAERVYQFYKLNGLSLHNVRLDLELELPWLGPDHDDRKVRVSGLSDELDPEELKFYLSALSENLVTEMFFNKQQTRAVAMFRDPIDYCTLVQRARVVPLKSCPLLRIQQEYKTKDLIATGDELTEENIVLPLESLLYAAFHRDIEINADKLPDSTDMWRITTEPEALQYILKQKQSIPRSESLAPFSDFLGLHVNKGTRTQTHTLSSLVPDLRLYNFLLQNAAGHQLLTCYLKDEGFQMSVEGEITQDLSINSSDGRSTTNSWRVLRPQLEQFIKKTFLVYQFDNVSKAAKPEVVRFLEGQQLTVSHQLQGKDNWQISVAGVKSCVHTCQAEVHGLLEKIKKESEEKSRVKVVDVPNVTGYQIEYLSLIDFFNRVISQHKLVSFTADSERNSVHIEGNDQSVQAVQTIMFDLLLKVSKSKVSMDKRKVYMKVFVHDDTQRMVKSVLLQKKIFAVWSLEDDTALVYAGSKSISHAAIECINSLVWDSLFPLDRDLDEQERNLLGTSQWKDKVFELEKLFMPFAISELPDGRRFCMSAQAKFQDAVTEDLQAFFDQAITRKLTFNGVPNRILFLQKYHVDDMRTLSTRHRVQLGDIDPQRGIQLTGLKNDLASCVKALKKKHDEICKQLHVIEHQAMIRQIGLDADFLEGVSLRTRCLVLPHKKEVVTEPSVTPSEPAMSQSQTRYSVTLPSGTVCEVRKADLTALTCDAIVNAANGRLQHSGGLAYAIVRKGGEGIQEECNDYVQAQGTLFDGTAYTSSAGKLNCKKVIHTVGPRWKGGTSREKEALISCMDSCFMEAKKHQLQSIAFPPISTGIFRYPLPEAVYTIVEAVASRESSKSFLPEKVIFADNKDDSLVLFERELRDRFGKVTAGSSSGIASTPVSNQEHSVNKILILNRVNVEMVIGSLVSTQADSLVNSVGTDFKLNHGKVAQAIAAEAGPQLQAQCDAHGPIKVGDVHQTNGFSLPCKKIIHCNCPGYQGPDTVPLLRQLVVKCLQKAASNNHQSIAFPSLGTGNLRYPESTVAQAMLKAVTEYAEKNPHSTIRHVKIVVYHLDMTVQKSFRTELHRQATGSSGVATPKRRILMPKGMETTPAAGAGFLPDPILKATLTGGVDKKALKGCVTVKHTSIRVIQGDLTNHRASVLVNSTDSLLSIRGQVSKALMSKAGSSVKREISNLSREAPVDGIWVSSAGDLNADCIFHVDAQSFNWASMITNCLRTCDANQLTSIAFPAIGTGTLGKPVKDMAKVILQTAVSYINDHPKTSLTGIDVVIFQPAMVKDFVDSMEKAIKKQETWTQLIGLKISQFFAPTVQDAEKADADKGQGPIGRVLLNMDIYGGSDDDIEACKLELNRRLGQALHTIEWKTKSSYKEDKQHIARMSLSQVQKLHNEAEKLSVTVDVDQQRCNITIIGLRDDVFKMSEMVSAELRNIENETNEAKEASLVAMTIQWRYDGGDGTMIQFPALINKDIEQLYSKTPNASYSFSADGGQIELNLSTMAGCDSSGTEFKIDRIDLSEKPATLFQVPEVWVPPLDRYSEHVVDPTSEEFKTVEQNFMATFSMTHHNFRPVPKKGRVLEVKRVQNPTLYQQYYVLRKETARRLDKTEEEVERVSMWHGTNEETVSKITSGRFDRGLSGKNATLYGCGSYFATLCGFSRQDLYARLNSKGHQFMIQTRVIVGDYCLGKKEYVTAPAKPNGQPYDSVVDNVADPLIFVVFNDAAAFPEYIIEFKCEK